MGKKNRNKKKNVKLEWRPKQSPPPPWTELPRDITANILHRLGAIQILESAQFVCSTWHSVCNDPLMWRVIDIKNPFCRYDLDDFICRRAVDLSQGELLDFSIEYCGCDDLLDYISQRCTRLKRLRVACCDDISGQGVSEAVKRFPQLAELHLFFVAMTSGPVIESIGRSCPLLNSFTFKIRRYQFPLLEENDEHALAVAETMPNLRHLRLIANRMTNSGLEGILAGCPNLESLDIQQCSNVDLKGDLGKRCAPLIHDLKHSKDSVADYELDDRIFGYEDEEIGLSDYSDRFEYDSDYDDYTDPFRPEYLLDSDAHLFDAWYI